MANNPRSIILCVPVGRFTAEDIETVNHFVKILRRAIAEICHSSVYAV